VDGRRQIFKNRILAIAFQKEGLELVIRHKTQVPMMEDIRMSHRNHNEYLLLMEP
jgi:hypothetical protein